MEGKINDAEFEKIAKIVDLHLNPIRVEIQAMKDAHNVYAERMHVQLERLNDLRTEVIEDRNALVSKDIFHSELEKIRREKWTVMAAIMGWILAIVSVGVMYFK